MPHSRLPQIQIDGVGASSCCGNYEPSDMIAADWIGCVIACDTFIWGRFTDVRDDRCEFTPKDAADLHLLQVGQRVPYLDSYYGHRAELILNTALRWDHQVFVPQDAVAAAGRPDVWRRAEASDPPDRRIPSGWDHSHCEICMATIGHGGEHAGWVAPPFVWVCETCYDSHVKTHSLHLLRGV